MEFAMDYHILFMVMSFMLLIMSVLLLFIDTTIEKAVAANIFIMTNIVICSLVALGFGAIDFYSYDSSGTLVHNVSGSMYPFVYIYWILGYVNIMLLFYCIYIYYKKPWEEHERYIEP